MIDSYVFIPGPVGGLQVVPGGALPEEVPGGVLEETWWSLGGGLQEALLV